MPLRLSGLVAASVSLARSSVGRRPAGRPPQGGVEAARAAGVDEAGVDGQPLAVDDEGVGGDLDVASTTASMSPSRMTTVAFGSDLPARRRRGRP